MAISYAINIVDNVSPAMVALEGLFTPSQLAANIGEAEVNLFQNHFIHAPTNKYGYPTTGFWPAAARATNWSAVADGVNINVNQIGIRQRFMGGDIFPVHAKNLAIPARAEAYGKTPGEFNNLQLAWHRVGGRSEAFALVEAAATQVHLGRKGKNGARSYDTHVTGGGVYFWLVKSVSQNPDPEVIPADEDILSVASDTVNEMIERASRDAGGAS
ncbi:MAG TPA: hypothetical protein VNN22_24190 [Verrucomicrobiae bacterium]|nr:hypothetical protein [Verrucomicrobiae bacterium]